MEPKEIRDQYTEYARIQRDNHQKAHPGYKFSPSKAGATSRKRRDASVEEDEGSSRWRNRFETFRTVTLDQDVKKAPSDLAELDSEWKPSRRMNGSAKYVKNTMPEVNWPTASLNHSSNWILSHILGIKPSTRCVLNGSSAMPGSREIIIKRPIPGINIFSPSKAGATSRKRRDASEEEDEEPSDLDELDSEWKPSRPKNGHGKYVKKTMPEANWPTASLNHSSYYTADVLPSQSSYQYSNRKNLRKWKAESQMYQARSTEGSRRKPPSV